MVLKPPERIAPTTTLEDAETTRLAISLQPATDTWWRLSFEVRNRGRFWDRIERITRDEKSARAQLGGIRRLQARGDDSVRNQKLERAVVSWGTVN